MWQHSRLALSMAVILEILSSLFSVSLWTLRLVSALASTFSHSLPESTVHLFFFFLLILSSSAVQTEISPKSATMVHCDQGKYLQNSGPS